MGRIGKRPPAVVAVMSYSGLAIVRSLARQGVKVYAVAGKKNEIGMSSRYAETIVLPNILRREEDVVEGLLNVARYIGEPAVLFPTGDALVLPVSRNREVLGNHYNFTIPEPELVEKLVSKDGLAGIVEEGQLPAPRSITVMDKAELDDASQAVAYPVILKPVYSASWYLPEMVSLIGVRKVIVVENKEQLHRWYAKVSAVDPRVVLQDFIPGADSDLYYTCGFFNKAGEPEAIFAGRKLRLTPIHFGSASFVESIRDKSLVQATTDLLTPLGYRGLFGVEFKQDSRDGIFKIIEVNVRFGLWDGLARRCGIDLAYLAYSREAGLPYTVNPDYHTGVKWLCFHRDLDAFLDYRKEGLLGFWSWIRSFFGETEHAVFAWDDPLPALVEIGNIIREKGNALLSRLKRVIAK